MRKPLALLIAIFVVHCLPTGATAGSSAYTPETVSEPVQESVVYFLDLVAAQEDPPIDADHLRRVVDFVASPKPEGIRYHAGKRSGAPSAYHEFAIDRSLETVLKLVYNPDLPPSLAVPSTVRYSYWDSVEGRKQPFPKLWTVPFSPDRPYRLRAVEYVEITPDVNSGVYYGYFVDRLIILARVEDRSVLISLSKQKGRSEVGKKGLVLGPDDDWNYLYTGEKGVGISGLGWVDSYMYDSFSMTIYVEDRSRVTCGAFNWVRAGWADMNVVRSAHIYAGLKRFARTFTTVIESPEMADPDSLARAFQQIDRMPRDALEENTLHYFKRLRAGFEDRYRTCRKWFRDVFQEGRFVARMRTEELRSILALEYLKYRLGKQALLGIGPILAESHLNG